MDKRDRLKYVFGMPTGNIAPDDPALMALVVGITTAVDAELGDTAKPSTDKAVENLVCQLPKPAAHLSPEQVVRLQLAALKVNDVPTRDNGVRVAWDFCSPESRDYLGDFQHFRDLYRDAMYRALVNFQAVEFQPMKHNGNRASQRFAVYTPQGQCEHYMAHLVLQEMGELQGCWLVDAILRVTAS